MNIRDLTYLVAVAKYQHFGKAAEHCHVSQPTLSAQIKKLEEQLGVRLFERNNRHVMATDVGIEIINAAKRTLHEVDTIHEIANNAQDPLGGTFRLGAFPSLATYLFPDLVPKIKQEMPNLRLILVEEKTAILVEQLRAGEIDAALLALPIYEDFLVSQKLFEDRFSLAVPVDHVLADATSISQSELSHYPLLLLEEGHCLHDQALEVCQLHNISTEQDFTATSLETLRQMVKAGTGITFMPNIAIREAEADIQYIPFENPAPFRTIGLVWRKTSSRTVILQKTAELLQNAN